MMDTTQNREIKKLVMMMKPDDRVQIVKDYMELEKTGVLGNCLLRTVTENLKNHSNGYFIILAIDIVHETTLHIAKKLYSLDIEE